MDVEELWGCDYYTAILCTFWDDVRLRIDTLGRDASAYLWSDIENMPEV